MDNLNNYFAEQRRRAEEHISYTTSSRHESRRRSRSPQSRSRNFRDENPSSSVKIRDMPSTINERDIKEFLDENHYEYSTVRLVRDRRTGQSRGVAFIEFYSVEDAKRCMEERNGEAYIRGYSMPLSYCFNKDCSDDQYESRSSNDSYLNDEPTNTIMLRGVPTSFSERDIRDELERMGILYTDVRLIRDKRTGMSRGFGFVEFDTVLQAQQWMESQQGVFYVGKYDLRMIYSAPRNAPPSSSDKVGLLGSGLSTSTIMDDKGFGGDWTCVRCGTHNFKRRNYCFKCHVARHDTQPITMEASDGTEYIGTTPCNTLTLHDLDALTTEETIRSSFETKTGLKIKNVKVMRDEVTSVSHCYAFVELNSIAESCEVVDNFTSGKQKQIFEIDGKAITINYAKNTYNTILASIELQKSQRQAMFEQQQQMIADCGYPGVDDPVNASYAGNATANAAAAVAQAALQQKQAQKTIAAVIVNSLHSSVSSTVPVAGRPFDAATALTVKYPAPDTSKFVFEETSGFYYDGSTGLYYDPNSTYFYDQKTQTYFYWDQKSSRYLPASMLQQPQLQTELPPESTSLESEQVKKEKEKKEKAKTAKKIAKDMERWAKQMNKQTNVSNATTAQVNKESEFGNVAGSSKTADTGFAMLEAVNNMSNPVNQLGSSLMNSAWSAGSNSGLVAHYGGDSDTEDYDNDTGSNPIGVNPEAKLAEEEEKLIDWSKLACLLCSRGFKDADTLHKHRTVSDLHRKNLEALRKKLGIPISSDISNSGPNSNSNTPSYSVPSDSPRQGGFQYRDRAKERREKFGIPSPPRNRGSKGRSKPNVDRDREEVELIPPPPPPQNTTGEDNVGSRLMQKMGWNLGQGLGRANQGRTDIIEPEFRQTGVGLGASESRVGGGPPSDNYKENVKRAMFARYNRQ